MTHLARIPTPAKIFRIRNSQLNHHQHAEFDLQIVNQSHSIDNFQLQISSPHNAHLIVTDEFKSSEEFELAIQMKIFTHHRLTSTSIIKLFVYVSQYDF